MKQKRFVFNFFSGNQRDEKSHKIFNYNFIINSLYCTVPVSLSEDNDDTVIGSDSVMMPLIVLNHHVRLAYV